MANETPKVVQTESLINPPETPVVAQPTQSITAASARKPKGKRGRPKKAAGSIPATTSSLTRTTRRIARNKTVSKQKNTPPAPKITMLNRLMNFSVVIAVFVTALAIQRIVPTETATTPKVEALPAQTATAPTVPAPETAVAPTAAPEATTQEAPPPTDAEAPKAAVTDCNPPAAATPQPIAKRHKATPRAAHSPLIHTTPLNAGGTEDLDSELARQRYMEKSSLATRATTSDK